MDLRSFARPLSGDGARSICLFCFAAPERAAEVEAALLQALSDAKGSLFSTSHGSGHCLGDEEFELALDALEHVAAVVIWIEGEVGPAELLIGLAANSGKLLLGTPQGSPARTVAAVVAKRFGVPLADNPLALADMLRGRVSPSS